ncbi:MAG TPA: hypothetical protein VGU68_16290 [Ktedonobacteraceae bacterium]|nr:hypothetical protein [Ktedonobacteraceae bacterium]HEV2662168.1 hypothetical protein [Ktedonobacteraceae bacterium]
MTTLGLDERLERVLAYALGWLSGLLLFLFEKNHHVRWHALQSMMVFGTLSILMVVVNMLRWMLSSIWFLNVITNFGLGLLSNVLFWVTILLWVWLMVMAWFKHDYRLPFISDWIRRIV